MPSNYRYIATSASTKVISLPKYEFKKILEKYPPIKKDIEENSVSINTRNDRRFTKMIQTEYKKKLNQHLE